MDLIKRQDAIEYFMTNTNWHDEEGYPIDDAEEKRALLTEYFNGVPSAQQWIPCSKRLPEDSGPVNITWVNRYYEDNKTFTATGHYCNGKWWWYSMFCQDYLNEYGRCDFDAMDDAIEVIAWMPLPQPWKESEDKK